MKIKTFVFNDFQENTYLLIAENSKECIIIDPGCNGSAECRQISNYIEDNNLVPKRLINTHCHIDHVLGNDFIANKYGLTLEAHAGEVPVLASCDRVAMMYGIPYTKSPEIGFFLSEGDEIAVGNISLKVLFCPGHSPASICLYSENDKKLIAGDVLFHMSIGRTDLPGGDYNTLINSIETKLWPLPDSVNVYPGHGIPTTIGFEKRENPFFNE